MLPPVAIKYSSAELDPLPTLNKANLKTESYIGYLCNRKNCLKGKEIGKGLDVESGLLIDKL